jgi:hypothetical protein
LRRLGVGMTIDHRRVSSQTLVDALDYLFNSPDVSRRCQELAAKFGPAELPARLACEAIEGLVTQKTRAAV